MAITSSMILMLGTIQGANLFARMAAYFEIAQAIAIPWMIRKIFEPRSAKLVSVAAGICYFGYFCYEFGVSKSFGNGYSAITLWQFFSELISG